MAAVTLRDNISRHFIQDGFATEYQKYSLVPALMHEDAQSLRLMAWIAIP